MCMLATGPTSEGPCRSAGATSNLVGLTTTPPLHCVHVAFGGPDEPWRGAPTVAALVEQILTTDGHLDREHTHRLELEAALAWVADQREDPAVRAAFAVAQAYPDIAAALNRPGALGGPYGHRVIELDPASGHDAQASSPTTRRCGPHGPPRWARAPRRWWGSMGSVSAARPVLQQRFAGDSQMSPPVSLALGSMPRSALVARLRQAGVRFNPYGEVLLASGRVRMAPRPRSVRVVVHTVGELGWTGGATLTEVLQEVASQDLSPCPLEVALLLRLAWLDHRVSPRITVASPLVPQDERHPRGFYLRDDDDGCWLRAYVASLDWVMAPEERLALMSR